VLAGASFASTDQDTSEEVIDERADAGIGPIERLDDRTVDMPRGSQPIYTHADLRCGNSSDRPATQLRYDDQRKIRGHPANPPRSRSREALSGAAQRCAGPDYE